MDKPCHHPGLAALLLGTVAAVATACTSVPSSSNVEPSAVPSATVEASVSAPTVVSDAVVSAPPAPNPYLTALERGADASGLGQVAQSQDDWRLVVNRWRQAIDVLRTIPSSNADYAKAQTKLKEYQRNLAIAQQQASRQAPDPSVVLTVPTQRAIAPPAPAPAVQMAPAPSVAVAAQPMGSALGFRVPIVRRASGTPVITVTFNGNQQFDMIVDTGASGTLVTQEMASALGVVPVGQASVDTASARNISVPLGYVDTMEAGGMVARNVLVAIAGPELTIGLLGHDFFGNFDVTIRQNEVVFQPRS
ncbi:retropepsin-like aspartic protease family protein [Leptolyngbya sp. AN02str]|uniref:retropepsin-like aspartic protease family protein n=1 Tax=Leptolyngbya sp. AN02str TaxID=3423363 RepID=UPI003D31B064